MRLKKYANLDPIQQHNSFKQFTRWRKERLRKLNNKDYSYVVPNVEPDIGYLQSNRKYPSITWVGHSTFLIQHSGKNIMTDPVWAGTMALQKRLAPPGLPIEDVPPIDIVLISHSHYDHLHIPSLRGLAGNKQLLVPAGLGTKLKLKGFKRVKELQWWEHIELQGLRFTFVPAQHWTRRNPWDTNSSHWGGWIIEPANRQLGQKEHLVGHISGKAGSRNDKQLRISSLTEQRINAAADEQRAYTSAAVEEQHIDTSTEKQQTHAPAAEQQAYVAEAPTIYFAGDSGYFQGFKEIGRRFAIDVALMPIGAYEPEWFMGPQHVTPEEALQAFIDVGAKWFVPMHYGAFKLADDTPREALDRLEANRIERNIDKERIAILSHGETWRLSGK